MIKINLYAGPGSGKSTVSGILYGLMKTRHMSCELVRERAKELVYEGLDLRNADDELQVSIFEEQLKRELLMEKGKLDLIVTDSPLYLNAFYSRLDSLKEIAKDHTGSNDFHFWINRFEDNFENNGRSHDESQSKEIDILLKKYLTEECNVSLIELTGESEEKAHQIIKILEANKAK